ncbi:general stress protein [Allocoleopsis sp.]|uniref:general stress protein n=1 Tax=Allocoleopsis sp. TaxID=3088169 RepID=UPI002FD3A816
MTVGRIQRAVGIFSNRRDAEDALTELRDAGFDMNKFSVIVKNADANDRIGGAEVSDRKEEQMEGATKTGATTGAVTGGLIGLIGGLSLLAIPGVGPVAEAGVVLANTILGSAIGAAGGAIVGALIGWGVPEERAKYYDDRVSQGDYLIVLEGTAEEILRAEAILDNRGVLDWGIYDADAPTTMAPGAGRTGVL